MDMPEKSKKEMITALVKVIISVIKYNDDQKKVVKKSIGFAHSSMLQFIIKSSEGSNSLKAGACRQKRI